MVLEPGGDLRTWSIGDLNRRAGRAVVKEFRGRIWAVGELTRLDERRGRRWLELVERGGGRDGRDAHLTAFCSATRWQRLERKLAEAGVELRAGQRVVVGGCLEIGDRGALALVVDDVDVDALVGDRLRDRRRLVQRLVDDGLFDANRRLPMPRLPLRVGVVASGGSDGHRDLVRPLESSGFAFDVTLRSIPVEGPSAPKAIQAALATFGAAEVDVAVMVRGGGAKASLDVFDRPAVAHAVATALVPVWTGIGHTGDRTVADEVAHRSFATPTAVGQGLVAAVSGAWDELAGSLAGITRLVQGRLSTATTLLDGRRREFATLARSQVVRHEEARAASSSELRRSAVRSLRDARRELHDLAADVAHAARRTCVDAGDELAAAAPAVAAGAVASLRAAAAPVAVTAARIGLDARRRLDDDGDRLSARREVLDAYDPRRQLARGWTLTHTADGRLVRTVGDISEGDALVTTFATGEATSTVTEVKPRG